MFGNRFYDLLKLLAEMLPFECRQRLVADRHVLHVDASKRNIASKFCVAPKV